MKMKILKIYTLFSFLILTSFVNAQGIVAIDNTTKNINDVKVGADRTAEYLPLLKGKSVAVVANQSSVIKKTHLVDSLITLGIKVKKVFCPEHGFRGTQCTVHPGLLVRVGFTADVDLAGYGIAQPL